MFDTSGITVVTNTGVTVEPQIVTVVLKDGVELAVVEEVAEAVAMSANSVMRRIPMGDICD
jgi:hypothetical protein